MVAFIVLVLLLILLGGLGFVLELFWYVLLAALIVWVLGFFLGGGVAAGVGRRRGWYRW